MFVAVVVGMIIGILADEAVRAYLEFRIEHAEDVYQPSSLCPHGVPWDECPDCSH
jgi:hypothetical protein